MGAIPPILPIVKTAVTIQDEIFEAAENLALTLGMSRSELYSTAIKEFVCRHLRLRITERLNEVYGADASESALAEELHKLQVHSMSSGK